MGHDPDDAFPLSFLATPASDVTLARGTVVDGDLEVRKRIGEGSSAAIYRVSLPDGSGAALKVLHTTEPTAVKRLLREGEALAGIHHVNVVRCLRSLEVDDHPALLMELVAGPTLADWLDAGGAADLHEALELFRGIARGVQAIESAGLVHRDLNPGNVLLSVSSAKRVVPKIADFGLVAGVGGDGLTSPGPLGTPAYMAPEQIEDARTAGPAADRFALGCILYEMVTGERAFQATDDVGLFDAAKNGRYLSPDKVRPDLPDYVTEVITTLLSPDPADRYPGVAEMLELLYLDDVPEITGEIERPEVVQTWSEVRVSTHTAAAVRQLAPGKTTVPAVQREVGPPPRWRTMLPWVLVALLSMALGLVSALWWGAP